MPHEMKPKQKRSFVDLLFELVPWGYRFQCHYEGNYVVVEMTTPKGHRHVQAVPLEKWREERTESGSAITDWIMITLRLYDRGGRWENMDFRATTPCSVCFGSGIDPATPHSAVACHACDGKGHT